MSERHELVVPAGLAGSRLDRCVASLIDDLTRSRVRTLLDAGLVTYNDGPAKPATLVAEGDLVTVEVPDPESSTVAAEDIPISVIYEDADILVIDKPTGLVVHPAAGNPSGTLVNALLHHCDDLSGIGGVARPGIVHRLDKDTTGLMVVAKSDRAHQALALAFRWRKVKKTYLAVCFGSPVASEGVVDAPLDRHPRHRQQMAVVKDGRPARTLYEVVEQWNGTCMVHCRLITGRTHQIRVHMAHLGHALVGDPLYSGRQWRSLEDPQAAATCRRFPRQALHAMRLAFDHPVTGDPVSFEAPLPEDLKGLIDVLQA